MENVATNKTERRTFLKVIGGAVLGTAIKPEASIALTLQEKAQRLISILNPEEIESVRTCLEAKHWIPPLGNASLVMMLLANLYNQENQQRQI